MNYFLALYILFNSYNAPKGSHNGPSPVVEINTHLDSFYYHYKKLSLATDRYYNGVKYMPSVRYLEKFTGIVAHSGGDYVGWYSFTGMDLTNWSGWYKKNYSKIHPLLPTPLKP